MIVYWRIDYDTESGEFRLTDNVGVLYPLYPNYDRLEGHTDDYSFTMERPGPRINLSIRLTER